MTETTVDNVVILLVIAAVFFAALILLNGLWELFDIYKWRKEFSGIYSRKMLPSDYLRKGVCRHSYARNKKGDQVYAGSSEAISWCLVGAFRAWLYLVDPNKQLINRYWDELKLYTERRGHRFISYYSDGNNKEDVIKAAVFVEKKLGLTK